MSDKFKVIPGIYVVPNHGRVNANKQLPTDELVKLYLNPAFAYFISPTPEAVGLLKKQGLTEKRIAQLIQRAKSIEEVSMLIDVKSTKTLLKLAEIRIKALE